MPIRLLGSGVVTFDLHSFSLDDTPTPLSPAITVLSTGNVTSSANGLLLTVIHGGNDMYSIAFTASFEKNAPTGRLSVVATPIGTGNTIILGSTNGFREGTVIVVNTGQHLLEQSTVISLIADGQIPKGAIGTVTLAADVISRPGPGDNKIKRK